MHDCSGVAVGKSWSNEGKQAAVGTVAGVGGLTAVKGATERQYRLRRQVRSAELRTDAAGAKAARLAAVPSWRAAQHVKDAGLGALVAGTYLGVKGLSGMGRNRREKKAVEAYYGKAWTSFRAKNARPGGAVDREMVLHRVLNAEMKAGRSSGAKARYAEQRLGRLARKRIRA